MFTPHWRTTRCRTNPPVVAAASTSLVSRVMESGLRRVDVRRCGFLLLQFVDDARQLSCSLLHSKLSHSDRVIRARVGNSMATRNERSRSSRQQMIGPDDHSRPTSISLSHLRTYHRVRSLWRHLDRVVSIVPPRPLALVYAPQPSLEVRHHVRRTVRRAVPS
jgi:hypothetical protein